MKAIMGGNSNMGLFKFLFGMIFMLAMGIIAITGFFAFQCYASGDPNNMACYMISNRFEVGVRNR